MGGSRSAEGSEPGYRRPVLIVQSDELNASRIPTVIVVPLTSNTHLAAEPGNVLVPADAAGLSKVSVVNVSQVLTIDRARLMAQVGALPLPLLEDVEEGLREVLALSLF